MIEELLTIAELAGLLKVNVEQVYAMNHAGTGPLPLRLGRKTVRYRREDILKWIESKAEGGGDEA